MKYYFIYSAGGGAGDWNGVKRVWNDFMPVSLKDNILLKFGDVFLNHAEPTTPCRLKRWDSINNLRQWLYDDTNDDFVLNRSRILLDSGSAKLVNFIAHNDPTISNEDLIAEFDALLDRYGILDKYVSVIKQSDINGAVTFDIPNPFKIRSRNGNARLNILNRDDNHTLIEKSAEYANELYRKLDGAENVLYTVINGEWNHTEIERYLNLLTYTPKNIAIGGISSLRGAKFRNSVNNLESAGLHYENIHFLGCGGLEKVNVLHDSVFDNGATSVDCSTTINRTIDGNVSGTSQSCYYSYRSCEQLRISPQTRERILRLHSSAERPLFGLETMTDIIDDVLKHQSNQSCEETYDARAKLLMHNCDAFKRHAE